MTKNRNFRLRILVQAFLLLSIFALTIVFPEVWTVDSSAQESDEQPWTDPVNLSNSGSTTTPVIVADGANLIHVVWQDEFTGSVYAFFSNGEWSPPFAMEFPFDDYIPTLVASSDSIYAFWINTSKDDTLNVSRVLASEFGNSASWTAPLSISKYVGDFDVEFQSTGVMHLSYIFTGEDAAQSSGVYYQRSDASGGSWTPPAALYISRYFRPVDPGTTNVDISATEENGSESIYTSWDDRAIKRVFLSKSTDQGVTWSPPLVVDGPTETASSDSPFNLIVQASGSDVLMIWQSNLQSGFNCTQYSQASQDGGKTWSNRETMLEGLLGCAQEIKLFRQPGGMLSQVIFQDQVYLIAWNGEAWSEPEAQSTLYSFVDPNTDEAVRFRCRQTTLDPSNHLFAVGCDEIGSEDIWATSREIGDIASWFPEPSIWNLPQNFGESEAIIESSEGLMDPLGRFHVFWLTRDSGEASQPRGSLYYTVWNNGEIAVPAEILDSPSRDIDRFSSDLDGSRNRLILTWNDRETGELFFSWSDFTKAGSVFEWAEPIRLPVEIPLAHSPDILAGVNGTIYIAYAIPINEGRGIYLLTSEDGGTTWSEASYVFDAGQENWPIVEYPRLAQTGDGALHLSWSRISFLKNDSIIGDYYARSLDGGKTWSMPKLIAENPSKPGWLAGLGAQDVFQFWISPDGEENTLQQALSRNGGENWGAVEYLSGLGEIPGFVDQAIGQQGILNLTQIIEKNGSGLQMSNQVWDGGSWLDTENAQLQEGALQDITTMSSGVAPDGRLVAAYSLKQLDETETKDIYRLFLISQKGTAPTDNLTPESVTPIPEAEVDATALPTEQAPEVVETTVKAATPTTLPIQTEVLATPAAASTLVVNPQPPAQVLSPIFGIILGGVLSVVVVAVFLVFARARKS